MLLIRLLRLIIPLLKLAFFLCLNLLVIQSILQGIRDGEVFNVVLVSLLLLFFILWRTKETFLYFISTYKITTKEYFLDTYVFPKELSKILKEEYPHLNKNEVEEVLEAMKDFYGIQIQKDSLITSYMPSRVVDFAFQRFFDMPESSFFSKKLLFEDKKYHRILNKKTTFLAGQYGSSINSKISEMWCYCCKKEGIDPFFPLSFPSFFTLDKRLKIPSGFIYKLDETLFREIHPISEAQDISKLRKEVRKGKNIDHLAKKIQYYLGSYRYCNQYQRYELEKLIKLIAKNQLLAHAVYGKYSDVNFFIETVLSSAATPPENIACSGASV